MLKRLFDNIWVWLDSLAVQTMIIVLVGIGAMHMASLWTYQRAIVAEAELANEARLADRLLAIKRTVMRADSAAREAVAHDMSGGAIEAHWSLTEYAVQGAGVSGNWRSLGDHLVKLAPELEQDGLVIGASSKGAEDPHLAVISVRLPDRSWVNVSLLSWSPRPPDVHGTLLEGKHCTIKVWDQTPIVSRSRSQAGLRRPAKGKLNFANSRESTNSKHRKIQSHLSRPSAIE